MIAPSATVATMIAPTGLSLTQLDVLSGRRLRSFVVLP